MKSSNHLDWYVLAIDSKFMCLPLSLIHNVQCAWIMGDMLALLVRKEHLWWILDTLFSGLVLCGHNLLDLPAISHCKSVCC